MVLSDEDIKLLKQRLLDMLSWFHGFCVDHNLSYYVVGGTMLGAARHQGFIPWDDDIDIGMPRRDYLRLKEVMKEYHHERYILETPDSGNMDYFYPMFKLYDTKTTLVENTRCQIKRGVFLDIFPIDGAGMSREEALKCFPVIKKKKQLLVAFSTGIRKGRSLYKNMSVALLRMIPGWRIIAKKLLKSLDLSCQKHSFEESVWGGVLVGNWLEKEIMPLSNFGKPVEYLFENQAVYGVENYDSYLTALYGDWRKLPPKEKRKSHHDFVRIDLEKSYLD